MAAAIGVPPAATHPLNRFLHAREIGTGLCSHSKGEQSLSSSIKSNKAIWLHSWGGWAGEQSSPQLHRFKKKQQREKTAIAFG